jgi:hypothetical protein
LIALDPRTPVFLIMPMKPNDDEHQEDSNNEPADAAIETQPILLDVEAIDGLIAALSFHVEVRCKSVSRNR